MDANAAAGDGRTVLFLCTGNYYRSRFAEILFNHLSATQGLAARADSAGLAPNCHLRNPGAISPYSLVALGERGIPIPSPLRLPRDATEADFTRFSLVVALKESEHRRWMNQRFPHLADSIRYWNVHDIQDGGVDEALRTIEDQVGKLIEEFKTGAQREVTVR